MSRRREVAIKKAILVVTAALVMIAVGVLVGSSVLASSNSSASEGQASYKYYTSIEVQPGDTLWAIAEEYMDTTEYSDTASYIDEVVSLNNLSDSTIHAGQYLTVAYYSPDFK